MPSSAILLSLLIGSVQPAGAQEKQASESRLGPCIQIGIGACLSKTVDGDLRGQSVSADERTVLAGGIDIGCDFGSIRADISAHRWHDIHSFIVTGHKYDSDENNYFGEST
ncbi:hypothetical protein PMIT1323_01206 [Prochlorococcus marinus str. MIT 1323]|nr:hypothetical protein PMIT1323_01206 [Prochlorococcus marinus str. MIT 1323]